MSMTEPTKRHADWIRRSQLHYVVSVYTMCGSSMSDDLNEALYELLFSWEEEAHLLKNILELSAVVHSMPGSDRRPCRRQSKKWMNESVIIITTTYPVSKNEWYVESGLYKEFSLLGPVKVELNFPAKLISYEWNYLRSNYSELNIHMISALSN